MLTQESAYQQIQDAKSMVEDDLQHKLEEFEEEREELVRLANTASALERELQQVNGLLSHSRRGRGTAPLKKANIAVAIAKCKQPFTDDVQTIIFECDILLARVQVYTAVEYQDVAVQALLC